MIVCYQYQVTDTEHKIKPFTVFSKDMNELLTKKIMPSRYTFIYAVAGWKIKNLKTV